MKLFNPESKFIIIMTKISDLMWLNLLTLALCVPVITAGAALTAKDYMCYKMVKDEEGGITKSFFRSFAQNFKQATIIWLIMLIVFGIGILDVFFAMGLSGEGTQYVRAVMIALLFFIYIASIMIFPMLSRFENTVWGTIRTGIHMTLAILPKAIAMGILYIIPIVIGAKFYALVPLVILFGITGPGYLSAMMYRKPFEILEAKFYEDHPEEVPETDPVEEAMQKSMGIDK